MLLSINTVSSREQQTRSVRDALGPLRRVLPADEFHLRPCLGGRPSPLLGWGPALPACLEGRWSGGQALGVGSGAPHLTPRRTACRDNMLSPQRGTSVDGEGALQARLQLAVFLARRCLASDCAEAIPKEARPARHKASCSGAGPERSRLSRLSGLLQLRSECCLRGPETIPRRKLERKQTVECDLQTAFREPSWFHYLALRRSSVFSRAESAHCQHPVPTRGSGARRAGGSAGGAGRHSALGHRHLTAALFVGDSGKRFGFTKIVRDTQRRCWITLKPWLWLSLSSGTTWRSLLKSPLGSSETTAGFPAASVDGDAGHGGVPKDRGHSQLAGHTAPLFKQGSNTGSAWEAPG